jgi:penicillin-binding protein 2
MNNIDDISDLNTFPGDGDHKSLNINFVVKFYKYIIFFIFIIFLLYILYISILNHNKYNKLALNNELITQTVVAPRGVIFSNGMKQLSYNVPSFNVYINISNLNENQINTDINILSPILGMKESKISRLIQTGKKNGYVEIPIDTNISKENDILISSDSRLKGVNVNDNSYIKFKFNNLFSHIIGYTGPISEQQLLSEKNVSPFDIVGRYGVEESMNKYLTGKDGYTINEINTYGNVVSQFGEKQPVPGDNIQLTISERIQSELQKLLIQSIKTNPNHVTGAAAIVENVNTGQILGMVSYPTFNNNDFEGAGISTTEYDKLLNNPDTPLLNRTISEQQPVGSIMKTILLSAGLQTGAITPNTVFTVPGTFTYDGTTFQNYAKINWGSADIVKCLQYSINVFAFKSALKIGINNFVKFEKYFGLGQKTNIQLPGEVSGIIADPKTKYEITGQSWLPGDLLNSAIGQGYTEVTPIQVVNWISAIANGGKLMQPTIIKNIYNYQGKLVKTYKPKIIREGFVSPKNLDVIKQGMYMAVQDGIDIAAKSTIADNSGKSGTAQFGVENVATSGDRYNHSHSWMSSFAPSKNPQIAMVVFEENGGLSTYSAEVVKNFMNWYFSNH